VASIVSAFSLLSIAKVEAQSCPVTSNETYGQLGVPNPFPGNPNNSELNPQPPNRQWTEVNEDKALCQYGYPQDQPPDQRAPKLSTLVGTNPTQPGAFTRTIKVSDGNWPVSFLCLKTNPCQEVRAPKTGYQIGGGYNYHVLYADENFITLANFAEDMIQHDLSKPETLDIPVLGGYTIHIANIIVDKNLLQLYRNLNAGGRHSLPAVKAGQVLGWAKGNDICVSIRDSDDFNDPRSRNDWWGDYMDLSVPFCKGGPLSSALTPGVIFQRTKKHPDEKEVACQRIAYGADQFNNEPYLYQDKNGRTQLGMRDDANLNFSGYSRGAHCGSVKSQPLVVTEVAPFDINEGETCKRTWWMAEIGFNYDNADNFHVPFVEEMADHWAGTLDAEHMKEEEIDKLYALAYPVFSPFESGDVLQRKIRDAATASAEIKKRQGVLKALLPAQKQDELKCSFIKYVQKKNSLESNSLYKDFAIEGTKLTDIPCPPTVDDPTITYDDPRYLTWLKNYGSKWSKMGLFPNEKSVGELRLQVCGDKTYFHSFDYPEVFRLGLAANELFKIFSDKEGQDRYYLAHGDNRNLKLPLDKNYILTAPLTDSLQTGTKMAVNTIQENTSVLPNNPIKPEEQNRGIFSLLQNLLPKIKSAFAQTWKNLNLLAQAPADSFHLDVSSDPSGNVAVKFFSDGCDGDIRLEVNGQFMAINAWNRNVNNPFVYGPPYTGPQIQVSPGESKTVTYTGTIVNGPRNCAGQTSTISCTFTRDTQGNLSSNCGIGAPAGPGGSPGEGPACHEPPTCKAACDLCKNAQLGPSQTSLWPQSYPHGHTLIGMDWNGSGYTANPIKFDFLIPEWDGTYEGIAKVPGCKYKQKCRSESDCQEKNIDYSYCFEGHGCGEIECARAHDRVIDIYNEVPFLASIWDQAFEADGGVERSCYTKCLQQQSALGQDVSASTNLCRTACAIPSGFLNIFKPKCDPQDANCVFNKATGPQASFNGCVADEKYVFNEEGDFAPNPGADYLTYDFHTWAGGMGSTTPSEFTEGVTVTQKSPKPGEKAKVLFYRLGGMCNANKWVTEKALNPASIGAVPQSSGNLIITPISGPCKGKVIEANKYYHKDTCEEAREEPDCCKNMGSGEYAKECSWEDRWWCRPESCNLIPKDQPRERCGAGLNVFFKLGKDFAQ